VDGGIGPLELVDLWAGCRISQKKKTTSLTSASGALITKQFKKKKFICNTCRDLLAHVYSHISALLLLKTSHLVTYFDENQPLNQLVTNLATTLNQ
jgi:hypothetical protein